MLLQDFSFYDTKKVSRKVKIVTLCFFLSIRIILLAIIIEAALILVLLATNTIEILGNSLSVMVLDDIDNIGALLLFNWIRTNFNKLSTQDNFMRIMSSPGIEMFLYSAYLIAIGFVIKISI